MSELDLLQYVDHTLLKAVAAWDDIKILCDEAVEYKTASVCIPASYVKRIHEEYGDKLAICTVIGFPLGYSTKEVKVFECRQALEDGASEIDMVINITDVKNGDYKKVEEEIAALKKITGDKVLKVIIETCYLTEEEKVAMCKAVTNAGADFIKTSTGFGTAGATLEDVRLFKANIGPDVKIKAAGGVKSVEDLEAFIKEGCARIGTSSAVNLIKGKLAKEY
ncbi:deoxyribose-phosphate aldolase [Anaerocolumna cellulosilytica]|uniref:Deoxyribose-phosphate aldolase n=1 Tax=Anaerocolumna cellulosilytica TaxID=433286 RepID=A0A6S6R114_9FIRM|nr:deoxyribose-phosphate aldolase [Anaerocolumna cellulosilytica]MBB5195744.1 deoxyribose-phosphate aldolase [Anaerocolumna cellulosilytica]BCJ92921.1 deoxyribose-phosphate aldolase [Anaerocolumna cellulosilytica]